MWFQFHQWSLRKRLTVLIPSFTLLFMLTTTLVLDIFALQRDEHVVHQQVEQMHLFLLNEMAEIILTGNPDVVVTLSDKLDKQPELTNLWLLNDQQQAVFQYHDSEEDIAQPKDFWDHFLYGQYQVRFPVELLGQSLGYAVYAYQRDPITRRLLSNLLADISLLPLLFVISLLIAQKMANSFAQPIELLIEKMNDARAELGEHHLPETHNSEEINQLFAGFNRLQHRIHQSLLALQQQLAEKDYMATHDALTDLWNRLGFDLQLQAVFAQEATQTYQGVFAFLDLDQFKIINNTVSHAAGDVYLRQLANYMREWLPEGGFIGRFGGDEFAIYLPDDRLAAEKIQELLELIHQRRFILENQPFQLGASVGLVRINSQQMSIMQLYQWGDAACYTAKTLGRNRYHWYQMDDQDVDVHQRDIQVLNQIRSALNTGPERFELWAQTIVPLQAEQQDQLHHYEILVRMKDAQGQIISPGIFLPVAERHGELLHLDSWVLWNYLEQACAAPEHLNQLGFVDINVTGAALVHPDFRALIERAIQTFDFPWHKLTLEVTETTAVRNFEQARNLIEFCKQHNIRFALDDFGSGMASFDYLKKLPFDVIKIDGSFITHLLENPLDEAMVNFMVKITELNGQLTVAEFVENEAIAERLRLNGVHYAQGYHFGTPKPLSEWL